MSRCMAKTVLIGPCTYLASCGADWKKIKTSDEQNVNLEILSTNT